MTAGDFLPPRPGGVTWYDPDGQQISMDDAITMLADESKRVVARSQVGERVVATSWLSVDLSVGVAPVPLIYETAVFPELDTIERTPTRDAALAMHDQVCAQERARQQRGG